MIVLDASVVVELLIGGPLADAIKRELNGCDEPLIVPHLIDIEVLSALRRLSIRRRIDSRRCEQLLTDLAGLPAERFSHMPLTHRMWELRNNFSAYDAAYIALAEAASAVLYTCDQGLQAGHRARVVLFTSDSRQLPQ